METTFCRAGIQYREFFFPQDAEGTASSAHPWTGAGRRGVTSPSWERKKIRITASWICTRRRERRHRVRRRHSTWTFPRQRHYATFPNNAQEKATLTIQTEV